MFAVVAHFVLRPTMALDSTLPPEITPVLLVASLSASAVALVMRRRVPRRSRDDSADLFWASASRPALVTWALLNGGGMLGVLGDARGGQSTALVVAGVAVVLMIVLNPARLERAS
jgi:hypothetical protein